MSIFDVLAGARRWHVEQGDALAVLRTLPDASVDAVVTDPPAGIGFMGKEWDNFRRARNSADRTSARGSEYSCRGRDSFVAFLSAILAECYRVAKPGARMFCWAIPRTCGWTQLAIEDAGWLVENGVGHLFGSGFPKSKSQLKPAMELWFLARKPGGKVPPLNVDACRVGLDGMQEHWSRYQPSGKIGYMGGDGKRDGGAYNPAGRWPPNLVLSHALGCVRIGTKRIPSGTAVRGNLAVSHFGGEASPLRDLTYSDADGLETVAAWQCTPDCPVKLLDEQSGERKAGVAGARGDVGMFNLSAYDEQWGGYGDTGTASRFFPQFPADDPDPFLYAAKASRRERNAGCEGLPERTSSKLGAGIVSSVGLTADTDGNTSSEDHRAANHHPTVKAQALMRWLCRLITPPGGTVLDPFTGSGSTGVACIAEGFGFIGIEREPDYVEIARARCTNTEAGNKPEPRPIAQQSLL